LIFIESWNLILFQITMCSFKIRTADMKNPNKDYEKLHAISRKAKVLDGVTSLLDWDQETYMPPDGAGIRAEQLKTLAGITHQMKTSKKFSNALEKLIEVESGKIIGKNLDDAQKSALRCWRRDYLLAKALPTKFVEEFAQLTSQATQVWRNARKENAFHQFAPFLEKIVQMVKKKADLIGYKEHPYDALIDLYEHGISTKEVSEVFAKLRKSIAPLIDKISKKTVNDSFLYGQFPQDQQIKFGHEILKAMDYDLSKGRLDLSAHPFSSACHPTDSRITTRVNEKSIMSNIGAVIHECGHALYEMGLPVDQYGSPLGEAVSLGMHESQSRWWETRIGLSKPFWKYFYPSLKQHFKGKFDAISLDDFYKGINKAEPSLIRIEADEVTYPLHIVLRFELELALIEGKLKVRDLPEAWNAKIKELLHVSPKNNAEGCLQDIHWSMGAFGYFPTYALGTMYASHLFLAFAKDHPDWQERVSKGDLKFIKDWLHKTVYQYGRHYTSKELLLNATGRPFSSDAFVDYLKAKYDDILK